MNFFRQLGSSIMVAVYGVILLGGGGAAAAPGSVPPEAFFHMFLTTSAGFALALLFISLMKEHPLRSDALHAAEAVIAD